MVEVLMFKNNQSSTASERHDYLPPQSMRSEATSWALEPSMLVEDAETLSESTDYQVLHHFSWGQESLPYRESATFTVYETNTQGYIKVYADDLLFINVDLDVDGFRMQEKRRLKLNERHFFDHPKFGLLVQVSRLLEDSDEEQTGSETDATIPATPALDDLSNSR